MPQYQSSSVENARKAVAARLRETRLDSGLKGHELAARCGWQKSKVSRIENARTPPTDADIREWCAACEAGDQAADIIAASRTAASMYMEWKRLQRTGLRRLQESRIPLYERTKLHRGYASHVVPGLFELHVENTPQARVVVTNEDEVTIHACPDRAAIAVPW